MKDFSFSKRKSFSQKKTIGGNIISIQGSKGISPLIAAVLLIAITVAIATLVTGWVSSTVRSTQVSVENKTTEAVECAGASIVVDDVWVNDLGATSTIRAIVRNSGQTNDMIIGNATVYNSSGGSVTATSPSVPLTDFDRGEAITFTFISAPVGTCPGEFREVLVTTTCGGVFGKFDKTPRCS